MSLPRLFTRRPVDRTDPDPYTHLDHLGGLPRRATLPMRVRHLTTAALWRAHHTHDPAGAVAAYLDRPETTQRYGPDAVEVIDVLLHGAPDPTLTREQAQSRVDELRADTARDEVA